MIRTRTIGLWFIAVLAMGAVLVANATAAGKRVLSLRTAGAGELVVGSELHRYSSNWVFTTSAGNIECTATATGSLTVNNSSKTKATFSLFTYEGPESGGACKTTTAFGRAEVTGCPASKAFVELTNKLQKIEKGEKTLCFKATFPAAGGISCQYEATKIKSTFNSGGPEEVKTVAQKYKRAKVSNAACPKEGTLSYTSNLTSGGEPVEAVLH
jgi:hypothetical protein